MRSLVIGVAVLIATACSPESEPVGGDPGPHRISPAETDPAITAFVAPHYAYRDTRVAAQNRLLVFLPGSGAEPERFEKLLGVAARTGLHAVALQYNNIPSLKRLCPDGGRGCFDRARREIVYGGGNRVDRAHSVEHRLLALLAFLARRHPSAGWGQYRRDGRLVWDRLILAGHSQGGSHVGLLARDHPVERAIHLGNSPSWIDNPRETPVEAYYCFVHRDDHAEDRFASCAQLGLGRFGDPVNVDTETPPYRGSHILFSERATPKPHSAIVADPLVPDDPAGGEPLYAPAWRYLLGASPR